MPGHKGCGKVEATDITEIAGADSLYEASGIIAQSEANAGSVFEADTFYSTEGSSLAIRAMLYIALVNSGSAKRPFVLAGRNAHKAFMSAAALLGLDIKWLYSSENSPYLSCKITAESLDAALLGNKNKPIAVYITSPDYLGNISDIAAMSRVCKKHGVPLLVDNAHGAYLKFLETPLHPIDLGADICCDSAHKTLPVLTGGAYLHVSKSADSRFKASAKTALALFGSTSPSYLIMQSLDKANKLLSEDYPEKIRQTAKRVFNLKEKLVANGFTLLGDEELKITLSTKPCGYEGAALAEILRKNGIECEFADRDYIVFMFSPENGEDEIKALEDQLLALPKLQPIKAAPPSLPKPLAKLSPREALLSESEEIPARNALGRILASPNMACPPAVPIIACGEEITEEAIECFKYYGIETCRVVK